MLVSEVATICTSSTAINIAKAITQKPAHVEMGTLVAATAPLAAYASPPWLIDVNALSGMDNSPSQSREHSRGWWNCGGILA
jgi:hypothetical protein